MDTKLGEELYEEKQASEKAGVEGSSFLDSWLS